MTTGKVYCSSDCCNELVRLYMKPSIESTHSLTHHYSRWSISFFFTHSRRQKRTVLFIHIGIIGIVTLGAKAPTHLTMPGLALVRLVWLCVWSWRRRQLHSPDCALTGLFTNECESLFCVFVRAILQYSFMSLDLILTPGVTASSSTLQRRLCLSAVLVDGMNQHRHFLH